MIAGSPQPPIMWPANGSRSRASCRSWRPRTRGPASALAYVALTRQRGGRWRGSARPPPSSTRDVSSWLPLVVASERGRRRSTSGMTLARPSQCRSRRALPTNGDTAPITLIAHPDEQLAGEELPALAARADPHPARLGGGRAPRAASAPAPQGRGRRSDRLRRRPRRRAARAGDLVARAPSSGRSCSRKRAARDRGVGVVSVTSGSCRSDGTSGRVMGALGCRPAPNAGRGTLALHAIQRPSLQP